MFDPHPDELGTLTQLMSNLWVHVASQKHKAYEATKTTDEVPRRSPSQSSDIHQPKDRLRNCLNAVRISFAWDEDATESLPVPVSVPISPSWAAWFRLAQSIKIRGLKASRKGTISEDEDEVLLRNASIDVDYGCSARYISEQVPKRLRRELKPNLSGKHAPVGWALWVEEDFTIPWYFLGLINLITIGSFAFGVGFSVMHGLQPGGWAVASYVVSLITFILSQWISKTKDSKRPLV